jgi:DNA-binding transcriptional LysR family regulator
MNYNKNNSLNNSMSVGESRTMVFYSREIQYFILVVEHRGIIGAARAADRDSANLSRMLKRLEKQVGARLFDRRKTGLVPTATALRLYQRLTDVDLLLRDFAPVGSATNASSSSVSRATQGLAVG